MNLVKRLLMGIGAIALIASFTTLIAPKAVHAAAAALLVQITNTTANPVPTADVHNSAAQSVTLFCQVLGNCVSFPPFPPPGVTYTVPAGQTLMVTDVEFTPQVFSGGGGSQLELFPSGGCPPGCGIQSWIVPNDGLTHQFLFPSGIPFPGGSGLSTQGQVGSTVFIRGYLTSN